MKAVKYIPILVLLFSCHDNDNNNNKSLPKIEKDSVPKHPFKYVDSIVPKEIRDTLRKISFVKDADHYYDSISNHKEGVTFVTEMIDTVTNEIYPDAVDMAQDHVIKLYRFKVNPATREIRVLDIETLKWLSIKEYIKLNIGK